MMTRWLPEDEPNMIPGFATHYIGKCTDVQSNLSIKVSQVTQETVNWVVHITVELNLSTKATQRN